MLFSVGGLFALYEAWAKLQHPHAIEGGFWWVPLAVLVGAIIAESFSFRTAIIESNHFRGKQSWVSFVRTAEQPEPPVILLEDLGALVGLIFALFDLGPEELLVAAKISVGAADAGRDTAAAIDGAKEGIRTAVPIARVIYLEPDLHRAQAGAAAASEAGAGKAGERDAKA